MRVLIEGISFALQGNIETWAQLGRKTPPLRYEIRESWRVRPTDSTGLMVGAVGIEPATLDLPVQCLCDSTSRKLVHGSVKTDKDFQKIRQPTTGEKRRLGELGNSRPFQKAN